MPYDKTLVIFISILLAISLALYFSIDKEPIKTGYETAFEEEVLRRLDKIDDKIMLFEAEAEIDSIFNEIAQKKYYAFIIDANSPFFRYDKYEVFLLDSPNLSDYDPNTSDWFLIDLFKPCGSDPNCVRRTMGYRSEEPDNILHKLQWVWGE